MNSKRTIHATATKEGKWWNVAIPELDQVTATKKATEIDEYATNLAATILDVPESELEIIVSYPMPPALMSDWRAAQEQNAHAKEVAADAAAKTKAVLQALQAEGYTVRDVAKVLGMSFQRISQILNT